MAIKTTRLRKEIKQLIADDPIQVQRFVLIDPKGYEDKPSYAHAISWPFSWRASWQGRIDTLGREVWDVMTSEAGTAAKRSFTLLLPYMDSGHPKTDDKIELYDSDGNKLGNFLVNTTVTYTWKTEVNVQMVSPGEGEWG